MRIIIILYFMFIGTFANNFDDFNTIKEDMKKALSFYKIQNPSDAIDNVKFARHHGFRNTGLEEKIKTEISLEYVKEIENSFLHIVKMMENREDFSQIQKANKQLLSKIEKILPKLTKNQDLASKKDWQKVANEVIFELSNSNEIYKQKNIKKAILHVQDVYFEIFENSGFEKAIMDISIDRKIKAEERFRVIIDMMKKNEDYENIKNAISETKQDLDELAQKLNPSKSSNNYYIFYIAIASLLIGITLVFVIRKKR